MAPDAAALWRGLRRAATPAPETSEAGWATAAQLQSALLVRGRAHLRGRRPLQTPARRTPP
jgi:hypothetical protein